MGNRTAGIVARAIEVAMDLLVKKGVPRAGGAATPTGEAKKAGGGGSKKHECRFHGAG